MDAYIRNYETRYYYVYNKNYNCIYLRVMHNFDIAEKHSGLYFKTKLEAMVQIMDYINTNNIKNVRIVE